MNNLISNVLIFIAICVFWIRRTWAVLIGKEIYIVTLDEIVYDIHPRAVKNLWLGFDKLSFYCSFNGSIKYIEIPIEEIAGLGTEL